MRRFFIIAVLMFAGSAASGDYLYEVITTPDDGQFRLIGLKGCQADGRMLMWVEPRDREHKDDWDALFCYERTENQVIIYRLRGSEYMRAPASTVEFKWLDEPCYKCGEPGPRSPS